MFDDVLRANSRYASSFPFAGMPARVAKGFALVTCMDTRVDPLPMLGMNPGDAKILRNAGGRVTPDILRSLVLATSFLGVTHIAVMHHTLCALADRDEDGIKAGLDADQRAIAEGWEFLAMPDPDAALHADVQAVRTCKLLPDAVQVEGWRYDVDTGLIARVIPS